MTDNSQGERPQGDDAPGKSPAEADRIEERKETSTAQAGETVTDKPAGETGAPQGGVEREDAKADPDLMAVGVDGAAGDIAREVLEIRRGMFHARGSGDTSGYGRMQWIIDKPQAARRPFGGWFDEVADEIATLVPDAPEAVHNVTIHRGEITFHIHRDHLVETARVLRDEQSLRFEFFAGVHGVNYPADKGAELHAVYNLMSMTHNRRIRLEVTCPDADPHIPSLVAIYPAADWHEREVWDMFGVVFDGHPALTRILMPDDWPGHPQRKDYPLGGIPVEYKGATIAPPDERRSYN